MNVNSDLTVHRLLARQSDVHERGVPLQSVSSVKDAESGESIGPDCHQ